MVARGYVQGVYYRASLQREAEQRAIRGWVRNQWDGSVEAVLQGSEEAVNAVLAWARLGPTRAVVESLDVSWSEPDLTLTAFEIQD
jgi:acylphosphatase